MNNFTDFIKNSFLFRNKYYSNRSYSQEGEDIIINRFFEHDNSISKFYVDIGAHHPFRFSNSYFFYKKGWSGICIDPKSNLENLFKKYRPRDIFSNYAIGAIDSNLTYYSFIDSAYNTLDSVVANNRIDSGIKLLNEVTVKVSKLSNILNMYDIKNIDFFNIDCEGFDLNILESNDWNIHRPRLICVEDFTFNLNDSNIYNFLKNIGYIFYAKSGNSTLYINKL